MKLTLLLVFVSLGQIGVNGFDFKKLNIDDSDAPVFVKSMKLLHRGPPDMPIKGRINVQTKTIEQKLDHFDQNETKTWEMRYMSNDEYFKSGGPIFIFLGGSMEISPVTIMSGHFVDMAREHNGYLFYTEHRYYGKSRPTDSLINENMKYLHVKQALADLAHFIKTIKKTVSGLENSKVIISGAEYSASMVVWFKRLYPDLVAGGWASSAPIVAKVDFREYMEVVGRSFLELGSQACYNRIEKGIAELESMIDTGHGAEVTAMLKICNNFDANNDLDIYMLFGSISTLFSVTPHIPGNDFPNTCNYIMSFDSDLEAIANFIINAFGEVTCNDLSYKSTLEHLLDSTYAHGSSRPWFYQTCNEYGWFQSSASRNQPFGRYFPALMYTVLCKDVFGPKFTQEFIEQQVAQTNVDFGGMKPEVENVYMTQGALDPVSSLGHGVNEGATVIPRAFHCTDFESISSGDSAEMRASKERLAELVRGWLAN